MARRYSAGRGRKTSTLRSMLDDMTQAAVAGAVAGAHLAHQKPQHTQSGPGGVLQVAPTAPAAPSSAVPGVRMTRSAPATRQRASLTKAVTPGTKAVHRSPFGAHRVVDSQEQAHIAHLKRKYGSDWQAAYLRQQKRLAQGIHLGKGRTAEDVRRARS